jgi:hypothetical protein
MHIQLFQGMIIKIYYLEPWNSATSAAGVLGSIMTGDIVSFQA